MPTTKHATASVSAPTKPVLTSRSAGPGNLTEVLLLPDGQILAHNLTPAMAEVLAGLNPTDDAMQKRSPLPRSPFAVPRSPFPCP